MAACGNTRCAAAGTKSCARCHAIQYCSAPCQKAHWRVHKLDCEAPTTALVPAPAQDAPCAACGLEHGAPPAPGVDPSPEACFLAIKDAVEAGSLQQRHHQQAERAASGYAAHCRSAFGAHNERTLLAVSVHGRLLRQLGRLEAAEPLLREALAGRRATLPPAHADLLSSLSALAALLQDQGRLGEAEPLLREALAADGSDATSLGNLASLLQARGGGQASEAEALYRQALAASGGGSSSTSTSSEAAVLLGNLASLLQAQGRRAEAVPLLRQALEARRRAGAPAAEALTTSASALASLLQDLGELEEAEGLYREALRARRRSHGPRHRDTLALMNNLAWMLAQMGRVKDAEALAREALEGMCQVAGAGDANTQAMLGALCELLGAQGRGSEAEMLRAEVEAWGQGALARP